MEVNFKFRLTISVIIMLLLPGSANPNGSVKQNPEEIHQQALDQADEIDLVVELLAEAANKGKFNQKNKKDSLHRFGNMRNAINTVKDSSSDNLTRILSTNEVMIKSLEFMTDNNFKVIPNISNVMVLRRPGKPLSITESQEKLKINNKKLETIQKKFKNLGLSTLNIATRKFEKIIKNFNIHKAIYRISPYALIMLYIMYVSRKEELEYFTSFLPEIARNPILAIKQKLMGTGPSVAKEELNKDNKTKEVHKVNQFESGPLSELHKLVQTGNLIEVEIGPILKWSPVTFLLGLIKNDWADLTSIVKKNINYLFLKLKNETIDDDTVFNKPTLSPDSLDVFEIPELKNLKNYLKYKDLFNLADHSIDRSYLFVGPQTAGYYMADILCAQLSKELNNDCRITQLNASDFVPSKKSKKDDSSDKEDKLATILADAKKHDFSIIVINDIDWISKQKGLTIVKLDKFLEDTSKKDNVIVIALTEKIEKVGDSAKNKLVQLNIDNPTYEQRIKFIKAQLRTDHAAQDIGIETIAKQTENHTLADLKKIVQDAYTIAYAEHKPFNKRHLAQSAAKMTSKRK